MRHVSFLRSVGAAILVTGAVFVRGDGVSTSRVEGGSTVPLVLDLDGCVAYALSNALDLAQQRLSLDNAALATLIARQKYAPEVSALVSHRDDDEGTSGGVAVKQTLPADLEFTAGVDTTDVADGDAWSQPEYAVTLSKRILGGGSYGESMLDIDNSLIDEVAAANGYASFQRDLVRRVLRQYYQLHRARQTLAIRKRRLEVSRTNLDHATAREDPLDIVNAQLEVPASEAALVRSQREIDSALDVMKQLVGAPLDAPLAVVGELGFAAQTIHVEDDLRRSAESHEDVLNQRLEIRKLENELPVRRSRTRPAVDVSAGARQKGDSDEDRTSDDWAFETRVTASWTLFAGAERARVRQLLNQLADADLALALLLRERETSLRGLARRLDESLRQVELGRRSLDVAVRRAALYSDRWENGAIDILEYIRSQNDLEDRRVDLVDLEITYLETLADYRNAVGIPVHPLEATSR